MSTSDARLGARLLEAMEERAIRFTVLHNEDLLSQAVPTSDVDVAVDRHPLAAIRILLTDPDVADLRLLMHWEYDKRSFTTFWSTADGAGSVQLDMLYDPSGTAAYGVRTLHLIERSRLGRRFPTLRADHAVLYSAIKRFIKVDEEALALLRPHLPQAIETGGDALSRRGRRITQRVLTGSIPRGRGRLHHATSLLSARGIRRALHPIGAVITGPSELYNALATTQSFGHARISSHLVDQLSSPKRVRAALLRRTTSVIVQQNRIIREDAAVKNEQVAGQPIEQLIGILAQLERRRLGIEST